MDTSARPEELIEAERYNWIYQRGYGHGKPNTLVEWANPGDVPCLDVGCGRGTLAPLFSTYLGFDVSEEAIEQAHMLRPTKTFFVGGTSQLKDRLVPAFELVVCNDVLEHIGYAHVIDFLRDLLEVNPLGDPTYLFSICCREAGTKDKDGEQVHRAIFPAEQWLEILKEFGFDIIQSQDHMKNQNLFVECKRAAK